MVFKWRDDHTDIFLDHYRDHECLWNVNSELYKNKAARDFSYNKICVDMNLPELTVADVRNKIKIIRTGYKSELNKIIQSEKSGSFMTEIYVPRLFWFKKADDFLRGVTETKEVELNLNPSQVVSSLKHDDTNLKRNLEEKDRLFIEKRYANCETNPAKDSTSQPKFFKKKTKYFENTNTNSVNGGISQCIDINPEPRDVNGKHVSKIVAVKGSLRKLPRSCHQCQIEDDEFDFFGKSIAVQLRKMPLERALICQENLQLVMKQERLYQNNRLLSTCSRQNQEDCIKSSSTEPFSLPASPSCSDASDSPIQEGSFRNSSQNTTVSGSSNYFQYVEVKEEPSENEKGLLHSSRKK